MGEILTDAKRAILEAVYSDPQLGLSGDPRQLREKKKMLIRIY